MRKGYLFTGIVVVFIAFLTSGCNIFSFTAPDSPMDKESDAWDELRDGNYDEAIRLFTEVIDEEPNNGNAYWGRSKASMRRTGETPISLVAEFTQMNTNPAPGDSSLLPFMNNNWSLNRLNNLYQGMGAARSDLKKIYSGQAYGEQINAGDVELDLATLQPLYAMLELRDVSPHDGIINSQDFNVAALFRNGGDFDYGNIADFMALPDDQQAEILFTVISAVLESSEIVSNILSDLDLDANIDIDALDVNLEELLGGDINDPAFDPNNPGYDGILEAWPNTIDFQTYWQSHQGGDQ